MWTSMGVFPNYVVVALYSYLFVSAFHFCLPTLDYLKFFLSL